MVYLTHTYVHTYIHDINKYRYAYDIYPHDI